MCSKVLFKLFHGFFYDQYMVKSWCHPQKSYEIWVPPHHTHPPVMFSEQSITTCYVQRKWLALKRLREK